MSTQKNLISMYSYSYFLVCQGIEGITHQESLIIPNGISNPANWILGHIITSRCNVLAILEIDPPWDFQRCKPYIPDSKPLVPEDEVEDFEIIKSDLDKTQDLLLDVLDQISTDKLNELKEENTIKELLEGYAMGAIVLVLVCYVLYRVEWRLSYQERVGESDEAALD